MQFPVCDANLPECVAGRQGHLVDLAGIPGRDNQAAAVRRFPDRLDKLGDLVDLADLQPRFDAAVDAFGADRLMWGSDFPFVQLNGGQRASLEAVRKFSSALAPEARDAILGGTARRLFRLP